MCPFSSLNTEDSHQPTALAQPLTLARVLQAHALSERELEILQWVAVGKTNPEIGSILGISAFTVKNHMHRLFQKLNVTNRAQAVAKTLVSLRHV